MNILYDDMTRDAQTRRMAADVIASQFRKIVETSRQDSSTGNGGSSRFVVVPTKRFARAAEIKKAEDRELAEKFRNYAIGVEKGLGTKIHIVA